MIEVSRITDPRALAAAHQIRKTVFVNEQGCPEDLEWEHEEESNHYLAMMNGEAAGTARWRETAGGVKLERFAVLMPYRSSGIGAALLKVLLQDVPSGKRIYLHAQLTAKDFYARYGFQPEGNVFDEAGIMHVTMVYAG